jgi:hypothetical protein
MQPLQQVYSSKFGQYSIENRNSRNDCRRITLPNLIRWSFRLPIRAHSIEQCDAFFVRLIMVMLSNSTIKEKPFRNKYNFLVQFMRLLTVPTFN